MISLFQNFWFKDRTQIYLIGNPMVWWLSTLAVLSYIAVRGFLILRAKRGYRDFDNCGLLPRPRFLLLD